MTITILTVGQTPPPYHGQSIMIERILKLDYESVSMKHVRMSFSYDMESIGKLHITKVLHLFATIARITFARFRYGARILYYPPAGPSKVPLYRDFIILIVTRWLFDRTVFHFHAGGVSRLYPKLSWLGKMLFRRAYYHPDASILLTQSPPRDDEKILSKASFVVPYGIEDRCLKFIEREKSKTPKILFVGLLKETKGVLVLIEALIELRRRELRFEACFVGAFESKEFHETVKKLIESASLSAQVSFTGVLTGDAKWEQFRSADIFAFPTFYEAETFGLVVLEAMQFGLPAIVSDWRGVSSTVCDGETGFVVPAKDKLVLADKIELLAKDPELRRDFGRKARERYLEHYSIEAFRDRIEHVFLEIA